MTNELMNLWITRLASLAEAPNPVPEDSVEAALAIRIKDCQTNILVFDEKVENARKLVVRAVEKLALEDSKIKDDQVTGWLAIDVPIPNSINPTGLMHRMVRRLYFAAVVHGLAEVPSLREAVQSLRLSYFQTRGSLTTGQSSTRTQKEGAEFSAALSLTKPLAGKLTAAEEVTEVERMSAEMQRMDLMESEDQLLYDLEVLTQLRMHVDRYAQFVDPKLPRWEHVRGWFRSAYARFSKTPHFQLRPLFVFEATSLTSVIALMNFLSDAASLPTAQNAEIVVIGGPVLWQAFEADRSLNHPIFRAHFEKYPENLPAMDTSWLAPAIQRMIETDTQHKIAPEVVQVLETMKDGQAAATPRPRRPRRTT